MRNVVTALALCALALPAAAQAQGSIVVGVIDIQKVTEESLMGKALAARIQKLQDEIEAERTKKQSELQTKQQEIATLQEELNKQRSVLSAEAVEKKLAEIRNKERDRQAFVEDGQRELQRLEQQAQQQATQAQQEYQQKLQPHIDAVAEARGVDLLIDSQVTHYYKPAIDISQDVIVKADDAARAAGGGGAAANPQ